MAQEKIKMPGSNGASYVLGIDLGTTSVKAAIVSQHDMKVIATRCRDTHAQMMSKIGSLGNEQDVDRILTALQFCLSGLPKELLLRVTMIGVAGQMHGVMAWKSGQGWKRTNRGRFERGVTSQLYTWQDGRCTPEFLATLPPHKTHLRVATGQGIPTLFWLQKHDPKSIQDFDCAGTIQDFVVAMLCGLERPLMSVQNAASWGFYDTVKSVWEQQVLHDAGFPTYLLPDVLSSGSIASKLAQPWYGIPEGTPVGVALGDLQCSFLSRHPTSSDAVLNISTSAQLAFHMVEGFLPPAYSDHEESSTVEYFPYFSSRYLAVAASLTGGNVLYGFVKMLQQWTHELGLGVPKDNIWTKIVQLGSVTLPNEEIRRASQSEAVLCSSKPGLSSSGTIKISGGKVDSDPSLSPTHHDKVGFSAGTDTSLAELHVPIHSNSTASFSDYNVPKPHSCAGDEIVIVPTIYGERHNPSQRGYVHNITPQNTGLGCVFNSLCKGVITNLNTMLPGEKLQEAGVSRIIGSGTAVVKNQLLQEHIKTQFGLPLTLTEGTDADAAVGAACAMRLFCKNNEKE